MDIAKRGGMCIFHSLSSLVFVLAAGGRPAPAPVASTSESAPTRTVRYHVELVEHEAGAKPIRTRFELLGLGKIEVFHGGDSRRHCKVSVDDTRGGYGVELNCSGREARDDIDVRANVHHLGKRPTVIAAMEASPGRSVEVSVSAK